MARPNFTAVRAPLAGLVALALTSGGCVGLGQASTGTAAFVDIDRPELRGFAVASMTDMERDARLETGRRDGKAEKLTPALFWSGIAVGTLGAVGGVTFGVLGYATKKQVSDGYDGDGLTIDERDELVARGEGYNKATFAMVTAAVLGYALAIVTYGVDWNRCGPLVRKHKTRRCSATAP